MYSFCAFEAERPTDSRPAAWSARAKAYSSHYPLAKSVTREPMINPAAAGGSSPLRSRGSLPGATTTPLTPKRSFSAMKDIYLREPTLDHDVSSTSPTSRAEALARALSFHSMPWTRRSHTDSETSERSREQSFSHTLFERIGGEEAVITLVSFVFDKVLVRSIWRRGS